MNWIKPCLFVALLLTFACNTKPKPKPGDTSQTGAKHQAESSLGRPDYDLIIRNGLIYDGLGGPPRQGDLAVLDDRILAIGALGKASASVELDAQGMAVAPGFINMLSWATESLIEDGRSLSDIVQGVTLEVMGEGVSMGPVNDRYRQYLLDDQGAVKYDVTWNTLAEYLDFLEEKGVSCNVASFVGASTLRIHEVGFDNRPPTAEEMDNMKTLLRQAMEEGALGLSSALIYTPGAFAETEELIELSKVAAEYDGMYISHLRSESGRILKSIDELIHISREAKIRAEIYHMKLAGKPNWNKLDQVIAQIEAAREEGLHITADMYTYTAGATGLDAAMPPWVQEGGDQKWIERLQDPITRAKVAAEMTEPTGEWENFFLASGPDKMILADFKEPTLRHLSGKTLAEVAAERDMNPQETAMDLVIENGGDVGTVYFLMSEENVKKQMTLPWMSFCSDAKSCPPEGVFLESKPHPRTYGNFARLLGKYVRDEGVMPLEEAIRRLTSLPAENLNIKHRGRLARDYYADIVIFDPAKIQDNATFESPHQLSVGMSHVFVNGVQVLNNGEHTGATPGRVVHGPGMKE